jgi:hypothetical protein
MLQFVSSQKGTIKLVVDNFFFTRKDFGAAGSIIWRCADRKCYAKVTTRANEIVDRRGEHSHAIPSNGVLLHEIREEMRVLGSQSEEKPQSIVTRCLSMLPVDVASCLPSCANLMRAIRKRRQIAELTIDTTMYDCTITGEQFIRVNEPGLILFASDVDLKTLATSQIWFADGTFKSAPREYSQLYSIHALVGHKSFPCAYALMSSRSCSSYSRLFAEIKRLRPDVHPLSIMTDFEQSAMQAFSESFPMAIISGCGFHFGQCIWRQIQSQGLAQAYRCEPELSLQVRKFIGLAYIPIEHVLHVYNVLKESADMRLTGFLQYFERTFVGSFDNTQFTPPIFQQRVWNLYDQALLKIPRSNNAVEGWHGSLASAVGEAHPTLLKLTKKLRLTQHKTAVELARGEGLQPSGRRVYRGLTQRMHCIAIEYDKTDTMLYLTEIAYLLRITK